VWTCKLLKMGTVCFSEMFVSNCDSIRCNNPEEQHGHLHHRENLTSHKNKLIQQKSYFIRSEISNLLLLLKFNKEQAKDKPMSVAVKILNFLIATLNITEF
jgi:hypothetical protein